MNEIIIKNSITFEDIKHIDELGNEFWYARELMPLLEYGRWENFHKVIKNSMIACEKSNNVISDRFPEVRKTIGIDYKMIKKVRQWRTCLG